MGGDYAWIRQSFMVPNRATTGQDEVRNIQRTLSADFKFTDTTLGGSFAINPPPQFTEFADIRVKGRLGNNNSGDPGIRGGNQGLGRYYSEALDDHGQFVHMRFGVPKFNSLTNFFFNFYNPQAARIANRGRGSTFFYNLGRALVFVVTLPLQPVIWAGQIIRFLINKPASKFYYLKPAMPLYWSAVSSMVNTIGVNMGVIGKAMSEDEKKIRGYENEFFTAGDHNYFHTALPELYTASGGIDIFAVATRAQRLAHKNRKMMQEKLEGLKDNQWSTVRETVLEMRSNIIADDKKPNFDDYIQRYHESLINQSEGVTGEGDSDFIGTSHDNVAKDESFGNFILSELEDGSQFVTFRVDDPGPTSESFSNSVGESDLANKINSMSSSSRSARFTFADGNVAGGVFGGAIEAVRDFVSGGLDQVKLGGLMALGGSAFVDIPKVWEASTTNLPRANFTIELRTPYGNPMSRFQNLIVPLSMILAGALPLSTGKQSYTSPFILELYCKGRNQIRLGMIDSLSITRGTGNIGWTPDNHPLGIDISFSVVDLSTVLHMPISPGFNAVSAVTQGAAEFADAALTSMAQGVGAPPTEGGAGPIGTVANMIAPSNFDDDNAYTDYLAVLGSLSLADQIYPSNKLRLRRAIRMAKWDQWKSPARHANWLLGGTTGRILSTLTHITDRQ